MNGQGGQKINDAIAHVLIKEEVTAITDIDTVKERLQKRILVAEYMRDNKQVWKYMNARASFQSLLGNSSTMQSVVDIKGNRVLVLFYDWYDRDGEDSGEKDDGEEDDDNDDGDGNKGIQWMHTSIV